MGQKSTKQAQQTYTWIGVFFKNGAFPFLLSQIFHCAGENILLHSNPGIMNLQTTYSSCQSSTHKCPAQQHHYNESFRERPKMRNKRDLLETGRFTIKMKLFPASKSVSLGYLFIWIHTKVVTAYNV